MVKQKSAIKLTAAFIFFEEVIFGICKQLVLFYQEGVYFISLLIPNFNP